jgi:hypothetical protein
MTSRDVSPSKELQHAMQAVWISSNLAYLYRYWATAQSALRQITQEPDKHDEFRGNELGPRYVEAIISNHLENHNYAGLLLTYALFDEIFVTLTVGLGKLKAAPLLPSKLRERGVQRYKKYIHEICAVTSDEAPIDWGFLEDFAFVRNWIVHANGNQLLHKNPREVELVMQRYPDTLSFKHDVKLVVSGKFVERCMATTERSALVINSLFATAARPT